MQTLKRRRDLSALLLAACVLFGGWFLGRGAPEAAAVFGAGGAACLVFFMRQCRSLYEARLIRDNRILSVPFAVVSESGQDGKREEFHVTVSTFGVLMDGRVYKWGCGGAKLRCAEIEREKVYLTFGDGARTLRMELLHGLTDRRAVTEFGQKLWRETGVSARISGW